MKIPLCVSHSAERSHRFTAFAVLFFHQTHSRMIIRKVDSMTVKERCKQFTSELGIPVTKFCKNIALSPTSYHDWQRDRAKLSEKTLTRISEYLERYGF